MRFKMKDSLLAGLLLAISLLTSACGGEANQADTSAAAEPATAATAEESLPAQTEAPSADAATATEQEAAPPQISETDDGSETVEDPPASKTAAPVLKLASTAKPEPTPPPSAFKEGTHYQRLSPAQPTSAAPGQVEIIEFFWYGCPHCFSLDPKLEAWKAKEKPEYVAFRRVPIMWGPLHQFHARIFYAAEQLGKLEELHPLVFREIHVNGNPLNTMDKVKTFFTSHGVDQATFDQEFASMALEQKLRDANTLQYRYRVDGVPFFVVNGKFTTDVGTAGGEMQLLKLLNELAARERVR